MKYKHIKGLQYHLPRYVDIDKSKYHDLLAGKEVVLKEKEVDMLKDLGIKLKSTEKKVKKEEKITNG
ncbi:MAG: hypothetical protein GOVbin5663_11 [Prokaryotic dsDNA virus sp.]|nr:MAG: hypothetical protein GOVbin5663_11 [Prokaryotic dsDNA virus sp.]|tara:strand:- start:24775 stop:24975 length:201 start_codon:yes stop_codon:yes gene_type:complete